MVALLLSILDRAAGQKAQNNPADDVTMLTSLAHLSCNDALLLLYHWSSLAEAVEECLPFCALAERLLRHLGALVSSADEPRGTASGGGGTGGQRNTVDKTIDKTAVLSSLSADSSGDDGGGVAKVTPALLKKLKADSNLCSSLIALLDVLSHLFRHDDVTIRRCAGGQSLEQRVRVVCLEWALQMLLLLFESDDASSVQLPLPDTALVACLRVLHACAGAVDRIVTSADSTAAEAQACVVMLETLRGKCRRYLTVTYRVSNGDDSRVRDTLARC